MMVYVGWKRSPFSVLLPIFFLLQCQRPPTQPLSVISRGSAQAVALVGDSWVREGNALVGTGVAQTAFINRWVADAPFHLSLRMSLDSLNGSTALFWLFGNHLGLDAHATDDQDRNLLFLYSPKQEELRYLGPAAAYFSPGTPFLLELIKSTDSLSVRIDQQAVVTVPLSYLAGPLTGNLGIRPWRNTIRLYDWTFEGTAEAMPPLDFVFESGREGYDRYAIPALVRTPRGDLLAFCDARKGAWYEDAGDIDLVMKRSTDGGNTWSPLEVILDDGPHSCQNLVPLFDARGNRWVLVSTRKSAHDLNPDILNGTADEGIRVRVMYGDAEGRNWSAPRDITDQVKTDSMRWYATGPGSGLTMEASPYQGRMVIACNHTLAGERTYRAHAIYSDDGGESWHLGGSVPGTGLNEGEVAEWVGGKLYMNLRNYDFTQRARRVSYSKDGGLTWSPPQFDPALPEPCAQGSVLNTRDPEAARLFFANPSHPYFRQNLTLKMSLDGGHTWPHSQVIYAGPSANSDIVSLGENKIGILFQAGRFTYTDGIIYREVSVP